MRSHMKSLVFVGAVALVALLVVGQANAVQVTHNGSMVLLADNFEGVAPGSAPVATTGTWTASYNNPTVESTPIAAYEGSQYLDCYTTNGEETGWFPSVITSGTVDFTFAAYPVVESNFPFQWALRRSGVQPACVVTAKTGTPGDGLLELADSGGSGAVIPGLYAVVDEWNIVTMSTTYNGSTGEFDTYDVTITNSLGTNSATGIVSGYTGPFTELDSVWLYGAMYADAVPEPTAFAMVLGSFTLLLILRRKRS